MRKPHSNVRLFLFASIMWLESTFKQVISSKLNSYRNSMVDWCDFYLA